MDQRQNTVQKGVVDQQNEVRASGRNPRFLAQLFLIIALFYTIFFILFCSSSTLAKFTMFSFPLNLFITAIIGEWLGVLIISIAYVYFEEKG